MSIFNSDVFNPSNKENWVLIPDTVACKNCPLLERVDGYEVESGILSVQCVSPSRKESVRMKVEKGYKGNAFAISGYCLSSDGIKNSY